MIHRRCTGTSTWVPIRSTGLILPVGTFLSVQFGTRFCLVGRKAVMAYTIIVAQETEDIWYKVASRLKDAIQMIDKTKR